MKWKIFFLFEKNRLLAAEIDFSRKNQKTLLSLKSRTWRKERETDTKQ